MIDLENVRFECGRRRSCASCPYKNKNEKSACWLSELHKRPSDWNLGRIEKGIKENLKGEWQ